MCTCAEKLSRLIHKLCKANQNSTLTQHTYLMLSCFHPSRCGNAAEFCLSNHKPREVIDSDALDGTYLAKRTCNLSQPSSSYVE
jgi:hypothetical protein